ncbi:MAG: hypothetical protein IPK25_14925 [Saprospiraceae bacterium]|nr:hypothetical protein [Saprospiraceae bacterium]
MDPISKTPQRVFRNDVENMFTFPNTLQTEHWAKVGSTEFGYGKMEYRH